VQYLNSSSLLERVEHLEKAIASATVQTPGIHRQLANNWERRLEEMEQRLQSIESEDAQVPLTKAVTEPSLFPAMVKPSDSSQEDEASAVDGSWFMAHSNEQDAPNIATASLSTMNHEQDGRGGGKPPLREDEASPPPFVESVPVESPSFSSPPPSWSPIHTLTGHSDWVRALAISSDGETLVSGSFDKTIKLWQLSTGQLTHTCSEHSKGVLCVAISPDGQTLASGSFDETIKLWRLDTGELIHTLTGHTGSVRSLAISPNSQLLISGSFDKTIKLWELETGRLLGTLTKTEPVSAIALTADGQTLASGGVDGIITLGQISAHASVEPALTRTLTGNFSSVCSLAISPDSQLLAAGCTDGNVKLWQLNTVEPLNILQCHSGPVMSIVFSSEAQTLYSGGADGTIKIWHLKTGSQLGVLTNDSTGSIMSIATSPNGRLIAGGGADSHVRIWQRNG
jgi:WD40 repeat protein